MHVNNRIVDHLEKCGLFSDFQYGFRSSRSTAGLLLVVSDRIASAFNRSGATRAVALDISKAFDRVWHAGLLHKLKSTQESSSKNKVKPFENDSSTNQDQFTETNTTANKESKKSGKKNELNETSIIDLALTLKKESHDVSVFNIIVLNDSDTLNKKGCEVNAVLMEMCREKNIYLIDNSKKVKRQHINKGKLHLNQKESRLLSDMFLKEISRVFN